ncbi:ATP-binding cassette domain-containing protein [Paenibacillus psychroresistens]|uniref:ATP-binding cassette domain-containing protein n=1 Tax=Paenibacillus psychroresistens TaxID=1778678 RepID=UPI001391A53D|nr:ATP-binding cassette domain-containing protein [Paenibacillus psychroresistens]
MNLQIDLQLIDITVEVPYENGSLTLLKDISLCISQGEWISIVGKNGSGKSTLAQLLTGVRKASSGIIQRGFSGDEPIPYVMQQEMQWFGETPWEDMIFLLESRGEDVKLIPEIIQSALERVGIDLLKDRPFAEMSGGQQQLAAIAGCLAARTPIIVFDEATSMLDSTSRQQVLAAAKTINQQGTAVVWLTHHIEDLSFGERVIALESGKISYDDSTTAFFYRGSTFDLNHTTLIKTPCEELGFTLPYPIQVAHELKLKGIQLPTLPLTSEQLVEAVSYLVK